MPIPRSCEFTRYVTKYHAKFPLMLNVDATPQADPEWGPPGRLPCNQGISSRSPRSSPPEGDDLPTHLEDCHDSSHPR